MVSDEEFRDALTLFPSGVTVVTAKDSNGNLHGATVSAFCSVSLEPPLILVCIDKKADSHYALLQTDSFIVNIRRCNQQYLSEHFASTQPDKFDSVNYRLGIDDLPILEDVLANLECRLVNSHAGGDHTIFVGQIKRAKINEGDPLVYFYGNYRHLGSQI